MFKFRGGCAEVIYSGDPEIGPPMGLTESVFILELVRFVKLVNCE